MMILVGILAGSLTVQAQSGAAPEIKPLWKAAQEGDVVTLTQLLDQGTAMDQQDPKFHATALMYAAGAGRLETVTALIKHGANVNLQDSTGETALNIAVDCYYPDCVEALLAAGADPNLAGGEEGNTPLMRASYQENPQILKQLLAAKAEVNARNQRGWTALIWAAWSGRSQSVPLLLAAGADVNLVTDDGESAFIAASQRGRQELATELLKAGAKKTKVLLNKSRERDESLNAAQRWALAASALMFQHNGKSHEILKQSKESAGSMARELRDQWKIKNRDDLLSKLDFLLKEGSRKQFQPPQPVVAKKDPHDFDAFFHKPQPNPSAPAKPAMHESYLAWDLCRYISLVRFGVTADYMTPHEAWAAIMPVAQRLQANYGSWEELGKDYMAGREKWSQVAEPRYWAIFDLLNNKEDPNSPWNQCPWSTPLGGV